MAARSLFEQARSLRESPVDDWMKVLSNNAGKLKSAADSKDMLKVVRAFGGLGRPMAELLRLHGQKGVDLLLKAVNVIQNLRPKKAEEVQEAKARTYAKAKQEILDYLKGHGWTVKDKLKVPQAVHPNKTIALFFKKQAVWGHEMDSWHDRPNLKQARSLHIPDLRKLDGPAFVADVERWFR